MDNFDTARLIGLSEEDARLLCEHYNNRMRVTSKDNMPRMLTMEFRMDRVNVSVRDGKVVGVSGFF